MKQIYGDLRRTIAEHPLAQFPNRKCHASLLRGEGGNVLFYSTGG